MEMDKTSFMNPKETSLSCSEYFRIHKKIILISLASGFLIILAVSLGLSLGLRQTTTNTTTTIPPGESMCKVDKLGSLKQKGIAGIGFQRYRTDLTTVNMFRSSRLSVLGINKRTSTMFGDFQYLTPINSLDLK